VSADTLERALPAGDRILLDASALIAYLNGGEATTPLVTHVVDELVRSGRNPALVSMVTVMELLVRPLRLGPGEHYRHAVDFLTRFPNLRCLELDMVIAQEAASLRATHGFATPDALVIATGIVGQVGHLVSNDKAWQAKLGRLSSRIRVCLLADHRATP
jgi:predicted nucleic acid-binding protein